MMVDVVIANRLKQLKQSGTLYKSEQDAQDVADALAAGEEDGWEYRVHECGYTYYEVRVYDEEGVFIAVWGA